MSSRFTPLQNTKHGKKYYANLTSFSGLTGHVFIFGGAWYDPFNQHSINPIRGPVGLGVHQIHGAVTMCDFLITCAKEFLMGVAMTTPVVVMLATYDQWFPIVRGWMV